MSITQTLSMLCGVSNLQTQADPLMASKYVNASCALISQPENPPSLWFFAAGVLGLGKPSLPRQASARNQPIAAPDVQP